MLNRLSVQNKILATLAVPIIVILLAATVFSLQSIQDWRRAVEFQKLNTLVLQGQQVIEIIQNERHAAVEYRRGAIGGEAEWKKAVDLRNQALDRLSSAFDSDDYGLVPADVRTALNDVKRDLRYDLESAADETRRGASTTLVVAQRYDTAVNLMLRVPTTIGNTSEDRRMGNAALAYVDSMYYQDRVAEEIPRVAEVLAAVGTADPGARIFTEIATTVRLTDTAREDARASLARVTNLEKHLYATPDPKYTAIRQYLSTTNAAAISGPLAETWGELSQNEVQHLTPLRDDIRGEMVGAANDWVNSTRTTAIATIGIMVFTIIVSLGIAYLISRAITRPLRRLTDAADRVKTELPRLVEQVAVPGEEPDLEIAEIKVESRDEVGQLAAAFNAVNSTTIEVAREQAALRGSIAEMFVNVARRDHVLLNRQLGFLDELERAEEDPSTLANLFRLDHLATRMRRNSESLLVLAGIDSGRRVREAMAMSDVVRTASSEIELYDRVQLDLQADPLILGHNALNAAHLIAELLENATNFSEPNTPVEVTVSTAKNFVTISIRDYGLGMSDVDIAEANKKVASRSASDVVGVQRVGLFVVGRLADRLGVHIAFSRPSDGSNGTVAMLSFPYNLFVDESHQPLPLPTDPLAHETQAATQAWVDPNVPVVSEVDLPAMTDGTTSTGMPRRRVASGGALPAAEPFTPDFGEVAQAAPAAELPSRGQTAGVSADLSNDSPEIVLPPLATPFLASEAKEDAEAAGWSPDTALVQTRTGLPTRQGVSSPVTAFTDDHAHTAPAEPEKRSAMFSSFRSFNPAELQGEQQDATAQVGTEEADGFVVPDFGPEDSNTVVSDSAVSAPSAASGAPSVPSAAPSAPSAALPADDGASRFEPIGLSPREAAHGGRSLEPSSHVAAAPSAAEVDEDATEVLPPSYAPVVPSASSADWADRFADLPTRASRAREALLASKSAAEAGDLTVTQSHPIVPVGQIPKFVDDLPEAAEISQSPVQEEEAWTPTFAEGQPLDSSAQRVGEQGFAEQTVNEQSLGEPEFGSSNFGEQGFNAITDGQQLGAEPVQEPAFTHSGFEPVSNGFNPAEQGVTPEQGGVAAGQNAVGETGNVNASVNAPALGAPAEQSAADAAHPFTPFSASSPTGSAGQGGFAGLSGLGSANFANASAPSFTDVVADATPVAEPEEKRGLFGKLFAKKEKKGKKEKAGKSAPQTPALSAAAPSSTPFSPVSQAGNGAAPQATSFSPVTPAQESPAPAQAGQPAGSFGQGFLPGGGQSFTPAPQSFGEMQNTFGGSPVAQSPEMGSGYQPNFQQSFQPLGSASSAPQSFSPISQQDAPAPGAVQQFVPNSPAEPVQDSAPAGGFAPQFTPAGSPAPAIGADFVPSGQESYWEPPVNFEDNSAFALQSSIQEQALAELSELSAYRPNALSTGGANHLTRRVRTQMERPADDPSAQKISRDAAQLRARLSAFQTATVRGRQDGETTAQSEQGDMGNEMPIRVPDSANRQ